jgi:hypothetical protein
VGAHEGATQSDPLDPFEQLGAIVLVRRDLWRRTKSHNQLLSLHHGASCCLGFRSDLPRGHRISRRSNKKEKIGIEVGSVTEEMKGDRGIVGAYKQEDVARLGLEGLSSDSVAPQMQHGSVELEPPFRCPETRSMLMMSIDPCHRVDFFRDAALPIGAWEWRAQER